ncbi:MAG: AAA family ATPase, partial [Acidimicrobiales bacterium]|nr:AAA family ATPase [Acidimicrobiales bacterium]
MRTESVALLFTDMVGSTALSQRLPAEDADEVRRNHLGLLRTAVEAADGVVVKSLGDGIMAVFSSASSALACSVAMQQAVEQDNRSHDHAIGLRVGMSAGEVVREDDDYFGDPAIEAARLCAICETGQILVTDIVRLLAGRRSQVRFRSPGPLSLKGIREPVMVSEVQWDPLPPPSPGVPFPPRLAALQAGYAEVVGREAELAALAAAAKRVFAGEGREVVLVAGEPGQGKTTLVAAAARLAYEQGACVLFGHSEEGLSTPYGLFAEAFAGYAAHAPDDHFAGLVDAHGSEWARFVPVFLERRPHLAPSKATDPDAERYLLFAAAGSLLDGISQQHPVVLVLDDLQWADPGSLALLHHLTAAHDQLVRVLVAGVFRGTEVRRASGLQETLGLLWRHPGVSRLELGGIDAAAVESLLVAAGGSRSSGDGSSLADLVHRETAGNPFFVTEMVRHLVDTGAIAAPSDSDPGVADVFARAALPTSVREVIGGRVARLGPDVDRVLSVAAVIGRDFDLDLLRRATGQPLDALLDHLDAAADASLVTEVGGNSGRYAFSHALVQRTLVDGLGSSRSAYLHEQLAAALEELPSAERDARVGELAHHSVAAPQPANLEKALRYSQRAAEIALQSLAPGDAARHFSTARALCADMGTPDPGRAVELSIGLGTAQRQIGDPAYRETLLDAARQAARLDDIDQLVAACLANDRGFYSAVGATDREKVEALEVTLGRLGADHPDRALVLATLCSELTHGSSLERRRELAEEAIALAESSGNEAVLVRVFNHLHVPLQVPPMLEVTEARTVEALRLAERVGDPVQIFWAAQWRLESAVRTGNLAQVDHSLAVHGAMTEILGQPVFTWGHAFVRSLR